jgi:hypothetical protein
MPAVLRPAELGNAARNRLFQIGYSPSPLTRLVAPEQMTDTIV